MGRQRGVAPPGTKVDAGTWGETEAEELGQKGAMMKLTQRRDLRRTMLAAAVLYFPAFGGGRSRPRITGLAEITLAKDHGPQPRRRSTMPKETSSATVVELSSTVGRRQLLWSDGLSGHWFRAALATTTKTFMIRCAASGVCTTVAAAGFGWHIPFQEAVVHPGPLRPRLTWGLLR